MSIYKDLKNLFFGEEKTNKEEIKMLQLQLWLHDLLESLTTSRILRKQLLQGKVLRKVQEEQLQQKRSLSELESNQNALKAEVQFFRSEQEIRWKYLKSFLLWFAIPTLILLGGISWQVKYVGKQQEVNTQIIVLQLQQTNDSLTAVNLNLQDYILRGNVSHKVALDSLGKSFDRKLEKLIQEVGKQSRSTRWQVGEVKKILATPVSTNQE